MDRYEQWTRIRVRGRVSRKFCRRISRISRGRISGSGVSRTKVSRTGISRTGVSGSGISKTGIPTTRISWNGKSNGRTTHY